MRRLSAFRVGRRDRWVLGAVAVLVAAGTVVALRSAVEPVAPPVPAAQVLVPPADRTPIPPPSRVGRSLRGLLPAVGGPDRTAVETSALLVLGRYCRDPAKYVVSATPAAGGWEQASARAYRVDRTGVPPGVTLSLEWTGRAYTWTGVTAELSSC